MTFAYDGDEITDEVNIWSWETIGSGLGIGWEIHLEERSIWTMEQKSIWWSTALWSGILGHLVRSEEVFMACMRIHPKSINEALKGLCEVGIWSGRGRHLVGRRGNNLYKMMTAAVTKFI